MESLEFGGKFLGTKHSPGLVFRSRSYHSLPYPCIVHHSSLHLHVREQDCFVACTAAEGWGGLVRLGVAPTQILGHISNLWLGYYRSDESDLIDLEALLLCFVGGGSNKGSI